MEEYIFSLSNDSVINISSLFWFKSNQKFQILEAMYTTKVGIPHKGVVMKEIKAIKKPRGTKRKEGRKKIILRIPSKVLYHSE